MTAERPTLRVARTRRASLAWTASVEWPTPFAPVVGPIMFARQGVGGIRVYALTRRAAMRRAGIAALREKRIPTSVAVALLAPPV